MVSFRQTGERLSAFVVAANQAGIAAAEAAPRRAAFAARNELRRHARTRFGKAWRVWDAKGLADSIRARKAGPGWWQVYSKSLYVRGRTEKVDLLWVFDAGPVVRSGKGKPYVAIPIPGQAPIHANGRRYAWPSEAQRMGWDLDFARVMGKDSVVVLGRRNRAEPFRPLYVLKPSVKEPKRFDVAGVHRRHAERLDDYWADDFDKRIAKVGRRAA